MQNCNVFLNVSILYCLQTYHVEVTLLQKIQERNIRWKCSLHLFNVPL